jgi:hypothetical protein
MQSVSTEINKGDYHNMSSKLLGMDITDITNYALNNNESKNEHIVRNKTLS